MPPKAPSGVGAWGDALHPAFGVDSSAALGVFLRFVVGTSGSELVSPGASPALSRPSDGLPVLGAAWSVVAASGVAVGGIRLVVDVVVVGRVARRRVALVVAGIRRGGRRSRASAASACGALPSAVGRRRPSWSTRRCHPSCSVNHGVPSAAASFVSSTWMWSMCGLGPPYARRWFRSRARWSGPR